MNLGHLDSEFLFIGTVYKLLLYNLMSISCLKCHNQIFFLKKVKILSIEKVSVFAIMRCLGQVV